MANSKKISISIRDAEAAIFDTYYSSYRQWCNQEGISPLKKGHWISFLAIKQLETIFNNANQPTQRPTGSSDQVEN